MAKIIWILVFIIIGILGGNGAVYAFNKLPASWLCDYGEKPKEDLLMRQRINSTPWKVLFSCFLVAAGVFLAGDDPIYAAACVCLFWILILISIADAKYMIVPDQLCFLCVFTALGFHNYRDNPLDMFYGALAGGGIMLLIALVSKLISHRETLGGGDIKLMTCLGFVLGFRGTVICLIGTSILSAMAFLILMAWKKIKLKDYQPLAPYISASVAIYLLVLSKL